MAVFRIVLILLVFIVLLILGVMNAQELTNVWLFREFERVQLAVVMLYSFAFGALCVGVFTLISEIQLRVRLRRQRREIDALTEELRAFRNAPLEPPAQRRADKDGQ